jgi:hypothetical protein
MFVIPFSKTFRHLTNKCSVASYLNARVLTLVELEPLPSAMWVHHVGLRRVLRFEQLQPPPAFFWSIQVCDWPPSVQHLTARSSLRDSGFLSLSWLLTSLR